MRYASRACSRTSDSTPVSTDRVIEFAAPCDKPRATVGEMEAGKPLMLRLMSEERGNEKIVRKSFEKSGDRAIGSSGDLTSLHPMTRSPDHPITRSGQSKSLFCSSSFTSPGL